MLKDIGKVAIAAAAAGVAALITRSVLVSANVAPFGLLATCGLVFGCVYVVAVWLLRIVTPDERTAILQRVVALQARKPATGVAKLHEAS